MVGTTNIEGPVALVGAKGMLARMVLERAPDGLNLSCYDLPEFDITDKAQVSAAFSDLKPRSIINCAAFTAVDACEEQEELATRVNAEGVANLARAAIAHDSTLLHISTDYVFTGTKDSPYREDEPVGPLSAYGRSKLKGEQAILSSGLKKFIIIRTSWLYGPGGKNFVETILRLAEQHQELKIIHDQIGSPTYTGDLADAIFRLLAVCERPGSLASSPYGIYHFADEGCCSWYDFARAIVEQGRACGLPIRVRDVHAIATEDYPLPAKRPANSVFDKTKYKLATGACIPDWRESLKTYFSIREQIKLQGD